VSVGALLIIKHLSYPILSYPILRDKRGAGGGGGGGQSSQKIFSAVWASVWSKIKGGSGPREPPMLFDNKTSSMSTLSSMNNHDDGSTAEKR